MNSAVITMGMYMYPSFISVSLLKYPEKIYLWEEEYMLTIPDDGSLLHRSQHSRNLKK